VNIHINLPGLCYSYRSQADTSGSQTVLFIGVLCISITEMVALCLRHANAMPHSQGVMVLIPQTQEVIAVQ